MSESTALSTAEPVDAAMRVFELNQRRAKAYSESGYWPDASKIAQALVKIEAGASLGLPPLVAMSEVHVIDGKPTLGAGALASLVKTSGRYDYQVVELTPTRCIIRFIDRGEPIGDSTFDLDNAKDAGLAGRGPWKQYPRNMLFARAISNGVAWYCPDVVSGRVYTPEEIDQSAGPAALPDELEPLDTVDIPFGEPDAAAQYELLQEIQDTLGGEPEEE